MFVGCIMDPFCRGGGLESFCCETPSEPPRSVKTVCDGQIPPNRPECACSQNGGVPFQGHLALTLPVASLHQKTRRL